MSSVVVFGISILFLHSPEYESLQAESYAPKVLPSVLYLVLFRDSLTTGATIVQEA